ncbi:MAG: PAS domain S-box protein [Desulfobacteraceae bacterium]|nr:PAS domain S-box protein [Desulfobacteraceae bacterium]
MSSYNSQTAFFRFFRSISGKLFLPLLVLLIPSLLIQIYILFDRFDIRRHEVLQANLEIARAASASFTSFVMDVLHQEHAIGIVAAGSPSPGHSTIFKLLLLGVEQSPAVSIFSWVSPEGRILVSSSPVAVGMDISDRSYYREIAQGREWGVSDLVTSRRAQEDGVFHISCAIRDSEGNLSGIVVATVAPDGLLSVVGIERTRNAGVSLFDSAGFHVYRYPSMNSTYGNDKRDWREMFPVTDQAYHGRETTAIVTVPSTGEERLAAFVPISAVGWVAAASCSEADVTASIFLHLRPHASMFLLVSLAAFAVALFLSRSIASPVKRLRNHALSLGRGDKIGPILGSGPDEIRELAKSFNKMADELRLRESILIANEQRYRHISENISDFAFSCTKRMFSDFQMDWITGAVQAITGYSAEYILAQGCWRFLVHPDDFPIFDANVLGMAPGGSGSCELRIITQDGAVRWIRASSSVVEEHGEDRLHRMFGSVENISERKNAEERLRSLSQFNECILDSLNANVCVLDGDGTILHTNKAWNDFAAANSSGCANVGVGANYLNACRNARGEGASTGREMIRGIEDVLQGRVSEFSLEYPSDSPREKRWYHVCVTPLMTDGPVRAVVAHANITASKRMEEQLRASEEKFRKLFRSSPVPSSITFLKDLRYLAVNEAFCDMTGYSPEEVVGKTVPEIGLVADREFHETVLELLREKGRFKNEEVDIRTRTGRSRTILFSAEAQTIDGERCMISTAFDITDRKTAEAEKERLQTTLRQAQKLEAIGTLAGGIAHDFNNILAPIIGYTEMALFDTSETDPLHRDLSRVLKAAFRARDLVKQILVFSRHGLEQERVPQDLGEIVREALSILRESLPGTIEIRRNIQPGMALADATQIHQIMMHLGTNAAHAMGDSGILDVTLTEVNLSVDDLNSQAMSDLRPGPYLRLVVSDTGRGMDHETVDRVFDPYFTTKEVGKGSGLGLAVVLGIVKRHEGAVTVRSQYGKGSSFTIYIPKMDTAGELPQELLRPLPRGTERILFVDDERMVADMASRILERLGYSVIAKTNSLDALEIMRSNAEDVDLLITDYTMPNLTGIELAREIVKIRPDLPIIMCTGYGERVNELTARSAGVTAFALKPLDRSELAHLVRSLLDGVKDALRSGHQRAAGE